MKFKVFCVLLFSSLAVIFLYSKYLNVVEPETEENLLSGIAFESLSEPNFFNPNKIAIIVINEGNDLSNYRLAVDTIKCYALQYNYTYVILNQKDSPRYASNCKQGDFMYRRHCILANFVEIHEKSINTVVFVDADMGIINPLHRLEEYIPKDLEHMYFYERMFNFEIACGSFIFKNTMYSRNFLRFFANYDYLKAPHPGRDNVAIHQVFLDLFFKKRFVKAQKHCYSLWTNSTGFHGNMVYVSCARWILNNIGETTDDSDYYSFDDGRVKVVKKLSSKRWCRDSWLSSFKWCESDFFGHGWKTQSLLKEGYMLNEFIFDKNKCSNPEEFLSVWNYNATYNVNCSIIDRAVDSWAKRSEFNHRHDLNESGLIQTLL